MYSTMLQSSTLQAFCLWHVLLDQHGSNDERRSTTENMDANGVEWKDDNGVRVDGREGGVGRVRACSDANLGRM